MINHLTCNSSAHSLSYADETTFLNRQHDMKLLEVSSNELLSEVKIWFDVNGFH